MRWVADGIKDKVAVEVEPNLVASGGRLGEPSFLRGDDSDAGSGVRSVRGGSEIDLDSGGRPRRSQNTDDVQVRNASVLFTVLKFKAGIVPVQQYHLDVTVVGEDTPKERVEKGGVDVLGGGAVRKDDHGPGTTSSAGGGGGIGSGIGGRGIGSGGSGRLVGLIEPRQIEFEALIPFGLVVDAPRHHVESYKDDVMVHKVKVFRQGGLSYLGGGVRRRPARVLVVDQGLAPIGNGLVLEVAAIWNFPWKIEIEAVRGVKFLLTYPFFLLQTVSHARTIVFVVTGHKVHRDRRRGKQVRHILVGFPIALRNGRRIPIPQMCEHQQWRVVVHTRGHVGGQSRE